MLRRLPLSLFLVLAIVPALSSGQSRGDAEPRDLQRLQEELRNLDEELALLEPDDRKADDFRRRGEEIREETIYLMVKMRHHQRDGGSGTGVVQEEVSGLQRDIRDLREDIADAFDRDGRDARLAQGTQLTLRLEQSISSRTARREDRFEASVDRPISGRHGVIVPAGTRVRGIVRDAEPAERPSRSGRLDLDFDVLYLEGTRVDVRTQVVSIDAPGDDQPGTKEKAGIGAVLGGVLGGILGGKRGLIAGILVGGTGAVVASKGDDVELPAGALVTVRLERPVDIPAP
jgi:hypothetical protein